MSVTWWMALTWWIAINLAGATITCIITDPIVGIRRKGSRREPGADVTVAAQSRRAPGRSEKRQVHR